MKLFWSQKWKSKFMNFVQHLKPTQVVLLSFIILIAVGTLLLTLPCATLNGEGLTWINALFTATSAACVTGLTVIDVQQELTFFGTVTLALLIQIGGLGMMTLGALVAIVLGRKVKLHERILLQESLNQDVTGGVVRLTIRIAKYTLAIETFFALILSWHFYPEFGWRSFGYGFFHAVSSFCNAGFDLFGNYDSLVLRNTDSFLLMATALLIILGGLGFVVLDDLLHIRRWCLFSLQTKVVLTTTAILILVGTLTIYGAEWNNLKTIGNLPVDTQLLNSFFTSVSTRTAGFNSFDLSVAKEMTLLIIIILMFIGASPASTGGGIKTTTLAVILLTTWSVLRGHKDIVIFGRTIDASLQSKAMAVFTLTIVWVTLAFLALMVADGGRHPLTFVLFETVSAYATVGLSDGITTEWNVAGKLILVATMFVGRVGILTFVLSLMEQNDELIKYPSENVMIG